MPRFAFLLLCIVSCADAPTDRITTAVQSMKPADARQLLRMVASVYSTCESYRDSGQVVMIFRGPESWTTVKPFKTVFVRPHRFKYEFTDGNFGGITRRYVVWSDGESTNSWWTIRPSVRRFKTISEAIAGPTGVSGGSAHRIPTLLLGTKGTGNRITDMKEPMVVGTQVLDNGRTTYVVDGKNNQGGKVRVWIDKVSHLLLRINETSSLAGGTNFEQTTTYKPQLNPNVDAKEFSFTPPHQVVLGRLRLDLPTWFSL
ncbi:MAG TPA: DUF2092 domain-containing protein [Thermoanaerobaculia bacterium]|nr:DUF2092 domain-containing protein [Thermoanaerobaculia bacterium]